MSTSRNRLPNRRASLVVAFELDGHHYRASGSRFRDGRLAEVFLDTGKARSMLQTQADTVAILVSLLLQHGVDATAIRHSVIGPIATAIDLLDGGAA